MATLTKARMEIPKEMAAGKVIREFSGFGNRMRRRATLEDRPYRDPGKTEMIYGTYNKEIKYSDFHALYFDLKFIKKYYVEWAHNYYELSMEGNRALQQKKSGGK